MSSSPPSVDKVDLCHTYADEGVWFPSAAPGRLPGELADILGMTSGSPIVLSDDDQIEVGTGSLMETIESTSEFDDCTHDPCPAVQPSDPVQQQQQSDAQRALEDAHQQAPGLADASIWHLLQQEVEDCAAALNAAPPGQRPAKMREFKQYMDARLAVLLAAPGRKFWATSDEEGGFKDVCNLAIDHLERTGNKKVVDLLMKIYPPGGHTVASSDGPTGKLHQAMEQLLGIPRGDVLPSDFCPLDIHMTDLDYEKFVPTWRSANKFLMHYASLFVDISSFITSGSLPTKEFGEKGTVHTCTPVGVESTSPASAWLCQQLIDADIRHLFKYPHLLAICHPGWHLYNRIGYGDRKLGALQQWQPLHQLITYDAARRRRLQLPALTDAATLLPDAIAAVQRARKCGPALPSPTADEAPHFLKEALATAPH